MTHRLQLVLGLLVAVTVTVGCSSRSVYNPSVPPETLGRIGASIDRNPDRMESILEEHNLTVEEFEEAVDRVSARPSLARRYREGFNKGPKN